MKLSERNQVSELSDHQQERREDQIERYEVRDEKAAVDAESIRVSKWLIGVLSGLVISMVAATFSGIWWASSLTQQVGLVVVTQNKMEINLQTLANSSSNNDTSTKLIAQSVSTLSSRIENIASRQTINEERLRLLEVHASNRQP